MVVYFKNPVETSTYLDETQFPNDESMRYTELT